MSTANAYLTVSGLGVDVVYKDIKNLHISVYPPVGRIRVAAPKSISEDTIRLALIERLSWIKDQRNRLRHAERQTKREMQTGETHYVWGRRYRLNASETSGRYQVRIKGNTLWVIAPESVTAEAKRAALDRWYRRELKAALPDVLEKWQSIIGVEADKIVVRRMKTKWGSCIPESATIAVNPELAKKDPRSLEYIVVHELIHLIERGHNARFTELMDEYLPDWRFRRDELNGAPLADEEWDQL